MILCGPPLAPFYIILTWSKFVQLVEQLVQLVEHLTVVREVGLMLIGLNTFVFICNVKAEEAEKII